MGARVTGCPLCGTDGGIVVWRGPRFRLVRVDGPGEDPAFPAFWRVVWNDHVREFGDLDAADRALCMDAVLCVEQAVRAVWPDAKINLASLGNTVPHLHWHVIARFAWDRCFPASVWAPAKRPIDEVRTVELHAQCVAVDQLCQDVLTRNYCDKVYKP